VNFDLLLSSVYSEFFTVQKWSLLHRSKVRNAVYQEAKRRREKRRSVCGTAEMLSHL